MSLQTSLGNILIVDADEAITELLQLNLRSEGYRVTVKGNTSDVDFSNLRDIHLIIVDGASQTPDGFEFIRQLKATRAGERIGVIYYSCFDSERTLIQALDAGADDSICKPFSLREMLARIRAVMRRWSRTQSAAHDDLDVVHFKQMRIDLRRKAVTIGDEFVNLSNTEYAILELLLRNANNYTSRIEIFRKIWPDGTGANERIVDTNISRLRRKLGELGSCIANRSGLGYMIAFDEESA